MRNLTDRRLSSKSGLIAAVGIIGTSILQILAVLPVARGTASRGARVSSDEVYMTYQPLTILRMREFGESVVSNLASSDSRISGNVRITHPDGSRSIIACAYPEVVGDWIFAFSLIDGFVLFGKDQVVHWEQGSSYERTTLGCTPLARSNPIRVAQTESRKAA